MNNKPKFYDSRFKHNNPESYSRNITIEKIYLCPRCNALIWETEILKNKKCNKCNLIFDISDIKNKNID